MLLFFTALLLFLLAITIGVISVYYEWDIMSAVVAPILIGLTFFFTLGTVGECFRKNPNVEEFNHRYSYAIKQIETYDKDTDFELISRLYTECKAIDSVISKNERLCHSRWRGNGYSEEIGNTPSIVEIFNEKFN